MRQEKFNSLRAVKVKAENLQKKFLALRKLQPLKNNDIKKATSSKLGSTTYKRLPSLVDRINKEESLCSISCFKKLYCENCLKTHNYVEDKSITEYRDKKVQELLLNFNHSCLRDNKINEVNNNYTVGENENNQKGTSFETISNYINSYSDPRKKAVSRLGKFQKLADDDDFFSKLQQAQSTSKTRKFKYKKLKKKVALPPIKQNPLKKNAKEPINLSKIDLKTNGDSLDRLCNVQRPKVMEALEDKVDLKSKQNLAVLPRLRKNSKKRVSMVSSFHKTNNLEEITTKKQLYEILPDIISNFITGESNEK